MKLEELFTVHVNIEKSLDLQNSEGDSVVMIPFTGSATGKYFEGIVLGGGVDTQIIGKNGDPHTLSARYMLQGTDNTGHSCKIYIENNGNIDKALKTALFRTSPKMITNSEALSFLNSVTLIGEGHPTESGVDIKIYRELL
ncbi:DUF3237 domain-containing protein [Paenibacillus sp. LS1]|uniref:DUF3237 domain-containing protein n=1 Tax=Paenibacillus sp. LS1 TaxID=2992120 RepID=UPI002231FB1F|nr:DUF3237 domain-containing protein [Paenibacillus sp. LS1]MCW3790136.1 DUF3237 domain-containing protein [Paenibacillus sp. LS1]